MTQYPIADSGFYHLTRNGWVRKDHAPFPQERLETWSYEAECPAEDAKEHVCLIRIWQDAHSNASERETLRGRFGLPIVVTTDRNITLECNV